VVGALAVRKTQVLLGLFMMQSLEVL